MKKAIIIGATGLVGSSLLCKLLKDDRFQTVKVLTRRPTGKSSQKLEELIVDFSSLEKRKEDFTGNILFSVMGTTIRKAGTKTEQYRIDHTIPLDVARFAANNGTDTCVLVTAAGADPRSAFFYSRMKGELEEEIKKLPFQKIRIIRPGILDGERQENRPMEKAGILIARGISKLPGLHKFRPVHADEVAGKMIDSCFDDEVRIKIYSLNEVFRK